MTGEQRSQRIKVAIFFLVTISVLVTVIFFLGSSQSMFARKATLHTSFQNTSGLISGAAVRLAGVDVGVVHSIHFDKDPHAKRIDVDLSIGASFLERIRKDSVAQIESKGLLGDMIIDITIGSADAPQLKDGDHLESAEVSGLNQVVESVQTAITKVNVLATDVDTRLREVLTPEVASDVGRITHSTAQMMDDVVKGKGLAHALIYEPNLARDANRVFSRPRSSPSASAAASIRSSRCWRRSRTGGGLLHGLVYEKTGGDAVAELEATARDLTRSSTRFRPGQGMIHSLVYEEDRNNLIQNLSEAARIIRHLAEETQEGKGTVGGLLVDPTAYEDLTTVLGNLKRNDLLKALIRYTIVTDGLNKSNGRVDPGTPVTPAPSPTP